MADTGWVFPTRARHVGAFGEEWANPDNIKTDDSTDATMQLPNLFLSKRLHGDTYVFAIPAGATIDGVEVELIEYRGVASGI